MWREILALCCAAMLSQDQLIFGVYSAMSVALSRSDARHGNIAAREHEVLEVFLSLSNLAHKGQAPSDEKPEWLSDAAYTVVAQLSQVKRGSPLGALLSNLEDFRMLVEQSQEGQGPHGNPKISQNRSPPQRKTKSP